MSDHNPDGNDSLKLKTARTLKWNTIDRVASQLLYAVVGIVLANMLSQEDFGLVGALLIFQAFATILTDGGFGMALLQKKDVSQADYSSVFWLNLIAGSAIYAILWLAAPLIADLFQHDMRLIALSRWMFLSFVINGIALVQTTRLMKMMNVRQVAVANIIGLSAGGAVGILLAVRGAGPWALVWQTLAGAAVKTAWLWAKGGWLPDFTIRRSSVRSVLPVGSSLLATQMLNTACLHLYSFVIGVFYSLRSLGVYTQADKWSKMGSATMVQILTASFVPLLARFSDNPDTHRRYIRRINRFTAMLIFPALCGMALVGAPLFHTLFGHKWDAAIPLFQILAVRGIFVVLVQLYYDYAVSLGRSKAMMAIEIAKDAMLFVAIICTIFSRSVEILVWGQLAASLITFIFSLRIAASTTGYSQRRMLADLLPFAVMTAVAAAVAWAASCQIASPPLRLCAALAAGAGVYLLTLRLTRTPELPEMAGYLLGRFRKRRA